MENIALVTIKFPVVEAGGSDAPLSPPQPASASSKRNTAPPAPPAPAKMHVSRDSNPGSDDCVVVPSLGVKFVSAGLAACVADLATFPLDTAKVRLQIQGESVMASALSSSSPSGPAPGLAPAAALAAQRASAGLKYRGLLSTVATVSREEGPRALYSGLTPGLQRQMCFASVRIGLYDAVKAGYGSIFNGDSGIGVRLLAGVTTGGAAVLVAQPTDVVKVRMQSNRRRYAGALSAYRKIAIEEGVRGLWKGTLPNVSRNAMVNCTELVSYDLIKEALLSRGLLQDNIRCHFLSAVGAGFFTTLFASPIDVIKTRFMNSGEGVYRGALHCASTMYREAGLKGFYKGCVPAFLRFGPWNVVMFVSYEQLKRQLAPLGSGRGSGRESLQSVQQPINIKAPAAQQTPAASRYM